MKYWFLMFFLIHIDIVSQAQNDSVHTLKEVEIQAESRLNLKKQGLKTEVLDSVYLSQSISNSLADQLSRLSSIYIKSYGGGSLASSSFRGGSAAQTAIVWNGFNLQSPVNGMIDLSLIPSGLFNQIRVQYGAQSAAWGSGAVGGTIYLQNKARFNQGNSFTIYTGIGSFGERNVLLSFTQSKANYVGITKVMAGSSRNNYTFKKEENDSTYLVKQSHAAVKGISVTQDNFVRLKHRQFLESHLWIQGNKRQIPPTLFQTSNSSEQDDNALRAGVQYKKYFNLLNFNLKSGFFKENLSYQDWELKQPEKSSFYSLVNELLLSKAWNRVHVDVGVNSTLSYAHSQQFIGVPKQNKKSLFTLLSHQNDKKNLSSIVTIRQEWVDGTQNPLVWSAGVHYTPFMWFAIKANAARVYRNPTLNDLYWKEGGNPNLKPEDGYAYEAGMVIKWSSQKKQIELSTELNVFSRKVNNWILWLPNGALWSPVNLMKVWSRGTESSTNFMISLHKIKLTGNIKTSYVLSENTITLYNNDASLNKQLIYVPLYSGQFNWGLNIKDVSLWFNHTYVGYRYTSSDHSTYLTPYFLHNFHVSYTIKSKRFDVAIQAGANNLLQTNYQAVAGRPMPGINFNTGLLFKFKNQNEKK